MRQHIYEQKRTENSGYGIELVLFDARYGKKATLELRVIDQFSKADKHRSLIGISRLRKIEVNTSIQYRMLFISSFVAFRYYPET